jgi:hypothetical protein
VTNRSRRFRAASLRAHARTRHLDSTGVLSHHFRHDPIPTLPCVPAKRAAMRSHSRPELGVCTHHTKLLANVDAEAMGQGRTPKSNLKPSTLQVISEPGEPEPTNGTATVTSADPATVRPLLAAAAAENVEQLTSSLLEAAGSAVKPVWLTVECGACGERSRVEAPVPDVRARVAAIELLLREGLGRAPQAEEPPASRMPQSVEEVRKLSWEQLEQVFAGDVRRRDGGGDAERRDGARARGGRGVLRG